MRRFNRLALVLVVLLAGSVVALSGIKSREDRLMDPYGRQKYFGEGYEKPLIGYGLKDAPRGSYGKEGVNGGREDFLNSVIPQGRNPGRVSHYDAGYRGYRMIDSIVELTPFESYKRSNLANAPVRITARVVSAQYNSVTELPKSTVLIRAINLPALGKSEVYEVWLMDEESGYALSLGFLRSNLRSGITTAKTGLMGGLGGLLASDGTYDLTLYDTIAVTREPYPDMNPHPGEMVALGSVPQRIE